MLWWKHPPGGGVQERKAGMAEKGKDMFRDAKKIGFPVAVRWEELKEMEARDVARGWRLLIALT